VNATAGREPGGLLRANVLVALGTGLSRVTGFLRLMALAAAIGQLSLADAYNIANNTPNIVYELLLGGVFSAALVPFFVARFEDRDDDAVSKVVTVSIVALLAVTVTATLAAPWIVRLYTTAAAGADPSALRAVATTFARFFLPQIFFYGIAGLATALLNAKRRFVAAAFAPALNNMVAIVAFLALPHFVHGTKGLANNLVLAQRSTTLVRLLGLGTTLGVVVSALVLLPALKPAGIVIKPRFAPRDPAVRELVRRSTWTIGYVVANQISVVVVTALAQRRSGEVSAYFNAYALFALPHGLLAASIITTFTPDLARAAHRGNRRLVARRMSLGLRALVLLVGPTAVLLVTLSRPFIGVVLEHGAFTAASAAVTARALAAFGVGLLGFSAYLFLLRGFYAFGDTRTPFVLNVMENALNIGLAVPFASRWGVMGLALSFSIAYVVAAAVAYALLALRLGGIASRRQWIMIAQVGASTLVMAGAAHFAANRVDGWLTRTVLGSVVAAVAFSATFVALRLPDIHAARAARP
jgi:putative peptidoglycan lipid II flippase